MRRTVNVYESAQDCTKTYLGSVDAAEPGREIALAADRTTVLEWSAFEAERYQTLACRVEVGFVPRNGETYRLIVREGFGRRCSVDLLDAVGRPVRAFDASSCEPH